MDALCTNFGNCSRADQQQTITVFQGGDDACPECGNRVSLIPEPPDRRVRALFTGISILALLLLLGWMLKTFSGGGADQPAPTAVVAKRTANVRSPASATALLPRVPSTPAPFACDPRDSATVRNLGVPLITELAANARMSPESRAAKIAARLNDCFVNDLKPPRTVLNLRQGNLIEDPNATEYVFYGYLHPNGKDTADIIATVDRATAAHYGVPPLGLLAGGGIF